MLEALRRRGPVRSVLMAWLLVAAGGWALTIALAVYAFDRSGTAAVGAVTAARLLPAMCAAPLTGSLIDRGDRGRVVAGACLLEAACVAVIAALVFGGASLVVIVVLAAASGIAATAPRPGLQALLPSLAASPEELTGATAAWSAADNAAFLLGAGVGGAAIAGVGVGAVVAVAAGMVAVAGVLAAGLPSVTATAADDRDEPAEGLSDLLAGFVTVIHSPMLRVPFVLFAGLLLLEGTSDVQLVALALGKLQMGTGGPGVLYGVWGVGGIFGSGAILLLTRRRGYGLALAVGALTFAAGLAVAGVDGTPVAVAAMVPAGLGFALVETAVMALVPRLADDAVVGRVYALSEVLYAGAAAVGALLAPVLVNSLGAGESLVAVGVAFAVLALLTGRSYARLDTGQEEAGRIRTLLRGVRFLEALPLPQLERLVRAARPVTFDTGATVLRAGEPGEEFFVIEHGAAEVVDYERRLGPGTGFGEIALLRDVPRTATIRATTDLSLWSIGRRSFLAAVSGHGDARRLADAVIAEHLAQPRVR